MDLGMVAGMLGFNPADIETFKQRAIEGVQDADRRLKGVETALLQIQQQNAVIQQQQVEILTQLGAIQNGGRNEQPGINHSNSGDSSSATGNAG